MFESIESVAAQYPNLIAALGLFGTFAAVIVSLSVVIISSRKEIPRLRASASISGLYHQTINPVPHYVTVDILNTGNVPIHIPFSFCQIVFPFKRDRLIFNPMNFSADDSLIPQIKYPYEIRPRLSHRFFISSIELFRINMAKTLNPPNNWLDRLRYRKAKFTMVSTDMRRFPISLSKEQQAELDRAANMTEVERNTVIGEASGMA